MHHSSPTVRAAAALLVTSSLAFAQWVQRSPATAPTARFGAAMDFVPQNLGVVLFGGAAPLINNQTWLYDGTNWTLLAPATSPTARFGASLVYDGMRGVAVLYGGLASNISVPPPTSETWEWDGATWTQAMPAANAGARYQYGACFDAVRGRVVMYGGVSSQLPMIPNAQTWEYDGTTWAQVTTTGSPGPRERPALCFYASIGRAVLFGGSNGTSVLDDTWLYDGAAGTWTQVAMSGTLPPPRNAGKLVWDATHDVCVLTGGQDANGPLADTWIFDGTRWSELPTASPPVRDHAFAFLPTIAQAVRFGGFVAAPNTLTNETWELGSGVFGVGCAGTNGVPTLAATGAPQLGGSWTVAVGNLNTNVNLAFVVFGLTKAPGIDLTFLGMPTCRGFTSPDLLIGVTGSAGAATFTWPTVVGPIGASLYGQALCLDPTVNTFGFTISNALYATITN